LVTVCVRLKPQFCRAGQHGVGKIVLALPIGSARWV